MFLGSEFREVDSRSGLAEVGTVQLIMRFSLLLAAAAVEAAVIARDACDAPAPDADGRYTISSAGIKAQVRIAISRRLAGTESGICPLERLSDEICTGRIKSMINGIIELMRKEEEVG